MNGFEKSKKINKVFSILSFLNNIETILSIEFKLRPYFNCNKSMRLPRFILIGWDNPQFRLSEDNPVFYMNWKDSSVYALLIKIRILYVGFYEGHYWIFLTINN